MRPNKETYSVKTYCCKICGHMFHTANEERKETCNHCRGGLEIIDRYKSRRRPKGSPPQGKPWEVK